MLNLKKLISSALECLGWPYVSPGTNDKNGIDCSGLWVKCFRDQGYNIYHGSNTIFREYCTETGKLTSENQLQVGMAVFKCKDWTDADKSNKWHGKEPGNLSHIGMVTSVNPLVITHATPPVCTQDKKIGKWAYWGKVKNVPYEGSADTQPVSEPVEEKKMRVLAESGGDVFMRSGPGTKYKFIRRVIVGTIVEKIGEEGSWSKIRYDDRTGWMMSKFLVGLDVPIQKPEQKTESTVVSTEAVVVSENGKPVKLRPEKNTSGKLYDELPVGTKVMVVENQGDWCKVNYGIRNGWYMMAKFLDLIGDGKGKY